MFAHKLKRPVLAFLFLNAVFILMSWCMTSSFRSQLEIDASIRNPVVIKTTAGRMKNLSVTGRKQYVMTVGVDEETPPQLIVTGDFRGLKIHSIRHVRRLVLNYECNLANAQWNFFEDCAKLVTNAVDWSFVGFGRFGWWGVLLVEFVIVLMSLLTLLFKACDGLKRCDYTDSLVTAFVATLMCMFIVPFRVYLSNHDAFDFPLHEVLRDMSLGVITGTMALSVILVISSLFYKRLFHVVLIAFTICVYLETGVLSAEIPSLNGEIDFFMNRSRCLVDVIVLVVVFLGVVVSYKFLRNHLGATSLVVLVLGVASVFDVRGKTTVSIDSEIIKNFNSNSDVVRSVEHSSQKNVAIYVQDAVSVSHALEAFKQCPDLAEELVGFTFYTNNLGMSECTYTGVAGMLTGRYYDSALVIPEYGKSIFSKDSLTADFIEANAQVYLRPGSFEFGYSSRLSDRSFKRDTEEHRDGNVFFRRISGQQSWNLYEVSRFLIVPFMFKAKVFTLTSHGWSESSWVSAEEDFVYSTIAAAPIEHDTRLTFQFWHTIGSHAPLTVDRNGFEKLDFTTPFEAKVEKTIYCLRKFSTLVRELKKRGLYDNSFLVLTADHGSPPLDKEGKDMDQPFTMKFQVDGMDYVPSMALPILLVKPVHNRDAFKYSDTPTSHCRIRDLCRREISVNQDQMQIEECLRSDDRLFRTNDGSKIYNCRLQGGELTFSSEESNLMNMGIAKVGHKYMFDVSMNDKEVPCIVFKNMRQWETYRVCIRDCDSEIILRMPSAGMRVRCVLELTKWFNDDQVTVFRVGDLKNKDKSEIRLESNKIMSISFCAVSDDEGFIHIGCSSDATCRMVSLTVDAM